MSFKKKRLHIQNRPYSKKVPTPKYGDLLTLSLDERIAAQNAKLINAKEKCEQGNVFQGYAAEVKSLEEIRALYKHLKIKHADATHVTMAYVMNDPNPEMTDYEDDGEIGAGRRIIEQLTAEQCKDIVIFIVHYHSGRNLGKRRFELILEIAAELVDAIKDQSDYITSTIRSRSAKIRVGGRRTRGKTSQIRGASSSVRTRGTSLKTTPFASFRPTYSYDQNNPSASNYEATDSDPEIVIRECNLIEADINSVM